MLIALLILGLISFLVYVLVYYCEDWGDRGLATLFILALGIPIIMLLNLACCEIHIESGRQDKSKEIYSLRTSSNVSGRFVLGSGRVDQQDFYLYFAKDGSRFYRESVRINNAYLIESDETPNISWQEISYKPSYWLTFINFCEDRRTKYDITVPKNTIIQEFKAE